MIRPITLKTIAIIVSNHRLVAVTDDAVSFRWKDYRHGSQVRTLTLEGDEFLRRFLLHVLPKGFVRIRYFGLLASRCRTVDLATCRRSWQSHRHHQSPHRLSAPCPRARGRARAVGRPCASSNG
jgi:hypothetical protein